MKKTNVFLLVVSIVLGILIGIQARTIHYKQSITTDEGVLRSRELALELKKSNEERDRQRQEIEDLNNKINKYENENKNVDGITKSLYEDIDKYRKLSCLTNVTGEGIILTIKDPKPSIDSTVQGSIVDNPEIILRLISVLNSADAEAISINGQRVSSYTEVERAGNHLVINGANISSPIIIKSIGDNNTLIPALTMKTGVVDTLKKYSYEVIISAEKEVLVEKLNQKKEFKHAETVDEK